MKLFRSRVRRLFGLRCILAPDEETFIQGKLNLEEVSFNYDVKNKIFKDTVYTTENDLNDHSIITNTIGIRDSSWVVLRNNPKTLEKDPNFKVDNYPNFKLSTYKNYMYYLIYVETKKRPIDVGPPITVIRFTKDGYQYEYNDLNCP